MKYLTKQNAELGMVIDIPGQINNPNVIPRLYEGEVVLAVRNKETGQLLEIKHEMYMIRP